MKITRKLWIGLLILAVLSPLGLLLPAWFGAGSAWGEWSAEEIKGLVGHVPVQMQRMSGLWHAPMPGYARPGASQTAQSLWYIVSALVGIGLVVGLSFLLGRWLARNEQSTGVDN